MVDGGYRGNTTQGRSGMNIGILTIFPCIVRYIYLMHCLVLLTSCSPVLQHLALLEGMNVQSRHGFAQASANFLHPLVKQCLKLKLRYSRPGRM
jgi:hypothetical protein